MVCSFDALPKHRHRLRSRAATDLYPHPTSDLERGVANELPDVLGHGVTVPTTNDQRPTTATPCKHSYEHEERGHQACVGLTDRATRGRPSSMPDIPARDGK
jgi:hypothetical protein